MTKVAIRLLDPSKMIEFYMTQDPAALAKKLRSSYTSEEDRVKYPAMAGRVIVMLHGV